MWHQEKWKWALLFDCLLSLGILFQMHLFNYFFYSRVRSQLYVPVPDGSPAPGAAVLATTFCVSPIRFPLPPWFQPDSLSLKWLSFTLAKYTCQFFGPHLTLFLAVVPTASFFFETHMSFGFFPHSLWQLLSVFSGFHWTLF